MVKSFGYNGWSGLGAVVCLVVFVMAGCAAVDSSEPGASRKVDGGEASDTFFQREGFCQVLTVYDGDTFGCDINGNKRLDPPQERIRLLGIDTPETHHSQKNKKGVDEPYAQAARAFLLKRIEGKTVYWASDIQTHDPYGRRLALVFLEKPDDTLWDPSPTGGEQSLNAQLVRAGLARTLFYDPNWRSKSLLEGAQFEAQREGRGVWSQKKDP